MKKEMKGDSSSSGNMFGTSSRTLDASELDRIFGGQSGPPNNPPSSPTPSTPTTVPGPYGPQPGPGKGGHGYDTWAME